MMLSLSWTNDNDDNDDDDDGKDEATGGKVKVVVLLRFSRD